jgi:hypothetical protein
MVSYTAPSDGTHVAEVTISDGEFDVVLNQSFVSPVPSGNLAGLCAASNAWVCDGFENGLNDVDTITQPDPGGAPPTVVASTLEGTGMLQLTTDDNLGQQVSGDVRYNFPAQSNTTFYVHMRIHFGDGYQAYKLANGIGGIGEKWFIITNGPGTCTNNEITAGDTWDRNIWQFETSCGNDYREDLGGDWDLQPRDGQPATCLYSDASSGDISGCFTLFDDHWYTLEAEIDLAAQRLRYWVDGALVIDYADLNTSAPHDQITLTNYRTGHDPTTTNTWRIWYDNVIVAPNCITSCGQ